MTARSTRRTPGTAVSPRPGGGGRSAGEAARDPRAAAGYPSGARTTPVPDLLFSRDLAALDDPLALRVLLWTIWHVHRRPAGAPPAVRTVDITADLGLRRAAAPRATDASGMSPPTRNSAESTAALVAACRTLVAHGLLLDGGGWVAVNDRAGRQVIDDVAAHPDRWPDLAALAMSSLVQRAGAEGQAGPIAPAGADVEPADPADRPNIFALYEQSIGTLSPILADELAEAAATYPAAWLAPAFRLAAAAGARKWSYVRAILTRWAREGYDGDDDEIAGRRAETSRRPDSEGPYAAWVKH